MILLINCVGAHILSNLLASYFTYSQNRVHYSVWLLTH